MGSGKGWLGNLFSKDRRRAERKPSEELAAYFWTGSTPVAHRVRDISKTGMYLLTDERWHPGTVVAMTLQDPYAQDGEEKVVAVQSKAIRMGDDGMGLEFVLPEGAKKYYVASRQGANRKTLEAFLDRFWKRKG